MSPIPKPRGETESFWHWYWYRAQRVTRGPWFWFVAIPAASFYGTLIGRFSAWILEQVYS